MPADISCPGVCMLNCNIQTYSSNILNFQQLKASVFSEHTQRLTWTPILRNCFFDHSLVGSDARGQNVPIQLDCKTNKLCQRVQRGHRSGCRLRGRVGSFGHVLMLKKRYLALTGSRACGSIIFNWIFSLKSNLSTPKSFFFFFLFLFLRGDQIWI